MFGIGFQEMLIILVVILIIFGPKRLPDLAKSLGKGIAEFRKASDEVRKGIEDAVREEEEPKVPPKESAAADATEAHSLESHPADATPVDERPSDARPAGAEPTTPHRRD